MNSILTKQAIDTPKIMVIGKPTALQQLVIKDQTREEKEIDSKVFEEDQLNGIEVLYVDFGQFEKGKLLTQNAIVQAAMDKHLPIVVENVDKENLTALAGAGITARVAIVENRTDVRGVTLTIIGDQPEEGLTFPAELPEKEQSEIETMTLELDTSNLTEEEIKQAEKEYQAFNLENESANYQTLPQIEEALSLEGLAQQVANALENHRNVREVSALQGTLKNNLPSYASYHIDLYWEQTAWKPNPGSWPKQVATLNVNYGITIYASSNPKKKWLKITNNGTGVKPGTLSRNEYTGRGYFTEEFHQLFGPYYKGGILEKAKPENSNDTTNVSVTTGFTIGANAGADADGPSVGIDASYSQSETVSNDIKDFKVINDCDQQWARFKYRLSKTTLGAYNDWPDMIKQSGWSSEIGGVPTWATNNLPPNCEGIWGYPASSNKIETLYFHQYYYSLMVWRTKASLSDHRFSAHRPSTRNDKFIKVDFSRIQLPHLGIGGHTTQSSAYSTSIGHSSAAVDGDVNGNFGEGSVTHTNYEENPYWQIDLGKKYKDTVIEKIQVWNRTDSNGNRLKNYHIFVSETKIQSSDLKQNIKESDGKTKSHYHVKEENGIFKDINIHRNGRYIRIQLEGKNYLSLAEVRIVSKGYS